MNFLVIGFVRREDRSTGHFVRIIFTDVGDVASFEPLIRITNEPRLFKKEIATVSFPIWVLTR